MRGGGGVARRLGHPAPDVFADPGVRSGGCARLRAPGPQCPTVPLGDVECAMGVPPGGIEWHNIFWQLRICRLSCHSVTSSALLAHHSVASSGAPVRWYAPGAVGEGGGTGRQRGSHGPLPMEDPLATRRASMTAEIAGTKARLGAAAPRLPQHTRRAPPKCALSSCRPAKGPFRRPRPPPRVRPPLPRSSRCHRLWPPGSCSVVPGQARLCRP